MPTSLIRGRYVICKAMSRNEAVVIEDGAVFQRDGVIVEVGKHAELAARHRPDDVLGSPGHVVLPGFVNSHHHIGLTPVQLGTRDYALELWWATRLGTRGVDPYLDSLYSAFEMIESGVTTVQHLQGWLPGDSEGVASKVAEIMRGYRDIGMRVCFSYSLRDQNRIAYEADEAFAARLPPQLGERLRRHFASVTMPVEQQFALFEGLYRRYNGEPRQRVQLAPANLHWCSDRALDMMRECQARYHVPVHMHVLESAYQKEYAYRRSQCTAIEKLHRHGLLGSFMTLGHGVWLTEKDIDLVAETGTNICHNASSNLRLRSGVAPVNVYEQKGVKVAIGIDEAGINDDRDMLQEIRMVLNLHRTPGMDDSVPTAAQVLRMATEHGAETTGFGREIGTLEPGKAADLVIMNWAQIAYPFLDLGYDVAPLDAILLRAKAQGVETVLV
ncbi:MAG: amidohydrolase family protein, partial [Alphaproteobacteria bacterium]|nr:amidohydrolase family protein [Alphaproteobacteria bacterium]